MNCIHVPEDDGQDWYRCKYCLAVPVDVNRTRGTTTITWERDE